MIRAATPADVDAIAAVQARAWRHAYADIVEPEDMPSPDDQTRRFADHVARGGELYVWDQDGRIAGFVAVDRAELQAIYVDPPAQGAGVGTALLDAAADAFRTAGYEEAFLWTFEANGLGRAFYERHQWEIVPGRKDGLAPEVRYRRKL